MIELEQSCILREGGEWWEEDAGALIELEDRDPPSWSGAEGLEGGGGEGGDGRETLPKFPLIASTIFLYLSL